MRLFTPVKCFIVCTQVSFIHYHQGEYNMQLNGKRVMLTGASGGIGEAIVSALAEQGAQLVITGRNQQKLAQSAHAVREMGGVCDVVVADLG
ncbi:MAG: SDR family NAD(P)-dependent oxidoreductase, partial [Pseudomonadales bacterium]|nr:SDR family NAD(P)-dependent oxidoreductase [Pseudomonadales bacterium]